MKTRRLSLIAIILLLVLSISLSWQQSKNAVSQTKRTLPLYSKYKKSCTSLGVGKKATIDGSTIIAQSADCGACDFRILLEPAADHPPGSTRQIWHLPQFARGLTIDDVKKPTDIKLRQPPHTYKYFKAIFGLMNEHQLAIAEATIGGREGLKNPNGLFDVTELSMLAMERCKTAREAIKLMGELAERYGVYVAGEQLVVADGNEVWDFEVHGVGSDVEPGKGKPAALWAAQRIPDDSFFICNNVSRIKEIDLTDTDNFMFSKNVISFAEKKGWWSKNSGKPFRFDKVYSDYTPLEIMWNRRIFSAYHLVAPSQNFDPDAEDYPFAIKPDHKLSVKDIIAIYRDHYEGTKFDQTQGLASGPYGNPDKPRINRDSAEEVKAVNYIRQIPVINCDYTVINQSRKWLPDPIGGIVWWGPDTPDTTVFIPFYIGITKLPESYTIGNHRKFGRQYAWWAFSFVNNWAHLAYSYMIKDIREVQKRLEEAQFTIIPENDKKAFDLYYLNKEKTLEFLTNYSINNANNVVNEWWKLADRLIVNYNDGGDTKPSREWIKALEEAKKKE